LLKQISQIIFVSRNNLNFLKSYFCSTLTQFHK
jgi:hypothetical protein